MLNWLSMCGTEQRSTDQSFSTFMLCILNLLTQIWWKIATKEERRHGGGNALSTGGLLESKAFPPETVTAEDRIRWWPTDYCNENTREDEKWEKKRNEYEGGRRTCIMPSFHATWTSSFKMRKWTLEPMLRKIHEILQHVPLPSLQKFQRYP